MGPRSVPAQSRAGRLPLEYNPPSRRDERAMRRMRKAFARRAAFLPNEQMDGPKKKEWAK